VTPDHVDTIDDAITEFLRLIDGTTKGLPDHSTIPADPNIIDVTPMPLAPEPQAPPEAPDRLLAN
jgi:hypothetical protein